VNGIPAIERLTRRLQASSLLDGIVLATTTNPLDDALVSWAKSFGLPVFRGSEDDVLLRVVEAQRFMGSDIVVEITGDATLTDPAVVDIALRTFMQNECDVVSTSARRSYPLGIDAQVFRLKDLEWVADNIPDLAVREHVSLYFYENPSKYRVINLAAPENAHRPHYRLVLDYPQDLEALSAVCRQLEPHIGVGFSVSDIVRVLDKNPEIVALNAASPVKPVR
jgi:spore coat polysaccharide biosynthesis protein SpsF